MSESEFRAQDHNKRRDWKDYRATAIQALDTLTILDPAVGSGAYPMGMLHLLVKVYTRLDTKYERNLSKLKRDILSRSLYGSDIDSTAIEISRLRAWLSLVVDMEPGEQVVPLPNLEFHFVCANTLIQLPVEDIWQTHSDKENLKQKLSKLRKDYYETRNKKDKLKRQKEFTKLIVLDLFDSHSDYLMKLKTYDPFTHESRASFFDPDLMFGIEKFDLVIGNPPYVQIQKFARTQIQKDLEKQQFKTFEKTGDLYALFYEHGMEMTKDGTGLLCYITSNKWMRAGYGASLRQYFVQHNPLILLDLGGKVFASATVDSNILLIQNTRNAGATKALTVQNHLENFDEQLKRDGTTLDLNSMSGWFIGSTAELDLKKKIEVVGTPLKDWDVKINYGIKTGLNEAFIITKEKRDELIQEDPKSAEIIKPVLRGRDIKRYSYDFAELYMICTLPALKLDIENYPAVKKHFLDFGKNQLEQTGADLGNGKKSRKKTGNKWFETQDQINYYNEFEKEKVVWTPVNSEYSFCVLPSGYYFNNSLFMITGGSSKYFCGYFNSKLLRTYTEYILSSEGDYTYASKEVVEYFPVPVITDENKKEVRRIEVLVEQILNAKKENKDANTKDLEKEIDVLVYELYGLNADEIAIVEGAV